MWHFFGVRVECVRLCPVCCGRRRHSLALKGTTFHLRRAPQREVATTKEKRWTGSSAAAAVPIISGLVARWRMPRRREREEGTTRNRWLRLKWKCGTFKVFDPEKLEIGRECCQNLPAPKVWRYREKPVCATGAVADCWMCEWRNWCVWCQKN